MTDFKISFPVQRHRPNNFKIAPGLGRSDKKSTGILEYSSQ